MRSGLLFSLARPLSPLKKCPIAYQGIFASPPLKFHCSFSCKSSHMRTTHLLAVLLPCVSLSLSPCVASVCDRVQRACGAYSNEGSDRHHETEKDLTNRTIQQRRGGRRLFGPAHHQETRRCVHLCELRNIMRGLTLTGRLV